MHSPFHIHEFTDDMFKKYAQRTGLFEVCSYRYEVVVRSFPGMVHFLIHKFMERTGTGGQLRVWIRLCCIAAEAQHIVQKLGFEMIRGTRGVEFGIYRK